jgi:hypothetical protein
MCLMQQMRGTMCWYTMWKWKKKLMKNINDGNDKNDKVKLDCSGP